MLSLLYYCYTCAVVAAVKRSCFECSVHFDIFGVCVWRDVDVVRLAFTRASEPVVCLVVSFAMLLPSHFPRLTVRLHNRHSARQSVDECKRMARNRPRLLLLCCMTVCACVGDEVTIPPPNERLATKCLLHRRRWPLPNRFPLAIAIRRTELLLLRAQCAN